MSISFFGYPDYYANFYELSNPQNPTLLSYGGEQEPEEYNNFLTPEEQRTPYSLECNYKEEYENSNTNINLDCNINNNNNNISLGKTGPNTEIIPKPKVFVIEKIQKEKKKLLGKKRNSSEKNDKKENKNKKDRKYDFDDVSRKIRARLFEACRFILNESLNEEEELENEDNFEDPLFPKGKQRKRKFTFLNYYFLKIDQKVILRTNIKENLDLLNSTLRQILSTYNVSKQVESYGLDYNKILIQKIEQSQKKKKTNAILDMTLLQCLEHFRKSKYYEPLKGLELLYDKLIKEMIDKGEDGNYIDNFIAYLNNYEIMYSQKKSKIKSKSNEINDENES